MSSLAPLNLVILFGAALLIFLGIGQRVLDRMRLTDSQALILIAVMVAGIFLPELRLSSGISLDIGGLLAPLGVAVYLLISAGTRWERTRAILASLITAGVVFAVDKLIPPDPGPVDSRLAIDPVIFPAIAGGIIAYLFGRSRRSAFIAGTIGVILTDIFALVENYLRGVPGALAVMGGAGALDATVISGFLAVALAEAIGETREFLLGGPREEGRPEGLLRGLRGRVSFGGEPDRPDQSDQPDQGRREPREAVDQLPVNRMVTFTSIALSLALVGGGVFLGQTLHGEQDEVLSGRLFTVRTEDGKPIMITGRRVHAEDEYIDQDNNHYVVTSVDGFNAVARFAGKVDLSSFALGDEGAQATLTGSGIESAPAVAKKDVVIGLYHSHNDEAYVPNQKVPAINGRGGIHSVGKVFADSLESKGYKTIHNENIHLPHDNGAYRRSRRTASKLINQQRAEIVFDVHRDAGPSRTYAEKVQGKWVTQIRLVVGRQNPQIKGPLSFAKELKAIADEMHPGLVKGIFFGRDAYNQDLSPNSMLLEVGTEQNAMQSAQRGVRLFADVVDAWVKRKF